MYSPKRRFRLFRNPAFEGSSPGSILFNGTGDSLAYSGVTVGTSAFTLEGWFRSSSFATNPIILFGAQYTSPGNGELSIKILTNTQIAIDELGVSAQVFTFPTMSTDTWYHFAFTRDGSNNLRAFLNGTQSSTTGITSTINFKKTALIAAWDSGGEGKRSFFPGYLSNLRIVVGTALYVATFTVPTSPLTAVPGTQLLLNTTTTAYLKDSSPNDYVLTPTGTPTSSPLNPFT
jgi:hypothetical protein